MSVGGRASRPTPCRADTPVGCRDWSSADEGIGGYADGGIGGYADGGIGGYGTIYGHALPSLIPRERMRPGGSGKVYPPSTQMQGAILNAVSVKFRRAS